MLIFIFIISFWVTTRICLQAIMLSFLILSSAPTLSVRLRAHLSRITAIVRLRYSIRQLQLSEYTCRWENRIIGRSMSYPGTIGGTSLHHQQQQTLPRHSRKMAYEERNEATSLYISYMVYMIITHTRCTMALFLAVISEERHRRRPSTSSSRPWERNLAPAQNAKSDPIWWNIYTKEKCDYQSNNLGVLIRLWEIWSGMILVRLRCIHAS